MILIIGSPDSGKSLMAEKIMTEADGESGMKKAYIATMEPYGQEGINRIKKHRKQREGKGFITYEKTTGLEELLPTFAKAGLKFALLECVSNLVGNEIYNKKNAGKNDEELTNLICKEILALDENFDKYVVVTNEFEYEPSFDEETKRYVRITSMVNRLLEERADSVYRVGIQS